MQIKFNRFWILYAYLPLLLCFDGYPLIAVCQDASIFIKLFDLLLNKTLQCYKAYILLIKRILIKLHMLKTNNNRMHSSVSICSIDMDSHAYDKYIEVIDVI